VLGWATVAFTACGCPQPTSEPPKDLASFQRMPQTGPQSYTRQTIVLFNLQRVLDKERGPGERTESMKLVAHLGADDPAVRADLAAVLSDSGCPADLQRTVLEFLLRVDAPDLAVHIARVLPNLPRGSMRDSVLEWLARRGNDPAVLAEVVKYWAEEPYPGGQNEPKFRTVVERVTGKSWEQSLVDAINAPGFYARGSAIDVLSKRVTPATLRQQIAATEARSEAFATLKLFLDGFEYVPATGHEFIAAVTLYKTQPYLMEDAIRLYRDWARLSDYAFNVRDFHLISRLARDPLRKDKTISRTQLILDLGQVLKTREHVKHRPSAPGAADDYIDQFWTQVDGLSYADLWNLYLLNTMLGRERVQQALRIMAEKDRADRRTAWGGLVFYQNGQAEAVLYPPSQEYGENDLIYVPTEQAIREGVDALCRFQGRFERPDNAGRAGPNESELREAKAGNFYGLILTSISQNAFCAHYYSPKGVVVSVGVFPFGK